MLHSGGHLEPTECREVRGSAEAQRRNQGDAAVEQQNTHGFFIHLSLIHICTHLLLSFSLILDSVIAHISLIDHNLSHNSLNIGINLQLLVY